jgi:hypothetical protein
MHQRDSLQLVEVFQKEDKEDDLMKNDPCDATDSTPSDSDYSSVLGGSSNTSSTTSTAILRLNTLEAPLSNLDISRNDNHHDDHSSSSSSSHGRGMADDSAMDKSSKSVTFADVKVREYPICLGDNPAVMMGAPLTISWEHQSEGRLSLDDYETSRPDRRRSDELRIPSFVRETMLKNSGYSRTDIQKGVRDVNLAKNQRKRTNETHRLHKAQEVAERLVRGTLNATVRRSKKKQERDLIDHFRTESSTVLNPPTGRAARRGTWHATNSST